VRAGSRTQSDQDAAKRPDWSGEARPRLSRFKCAQAALLVKLDD
jgi:hypothetical protein